MSRRSRACACATEPEPSSETDRVVTLVHGTFARHAEWVQDGSPLVSELVGHAVVDRFCWTGKNRHRDRLDAGSALRSHLVDLIKRHRVGGRRPEHHVIAHSHGGNVALYALRPRGDDDDELLARVKLITLATPFLTMQKRDLPRSLLVLMGILLLGAGGSLGEAVAGSVSGGAFAFSLGYGIFGVGAFLAFALSVLLYRRGNPVPVFRDLVLGRGVERDAAAISAAELEPGRLLVMRGLGDEAAGLLGAAQLSSWGMSKIATRLSTGRLIRLVGVWILVLLATFAVTAFFNDSEELTPFENAVADVSGTVLAVVLLIAIVTPGFIVFANLPFGLDTLFWNFHARTTADPVPLGGARMLQVRQRDSAAEITQETSHSLYDDPPAVRAMVASVLGRDPFAAADAVPATGAPA